ncbi:MAG: ATP-binding protein [Tannerella sp.]|jgi:ATP-dependent DNA helicase RecG|nr:ATP-binding protein [Tannerella sp.]
MTFAQLQDIIRGGENISVEFKKCPAELNHSVFETVCSFLNRTGGHLILGVADNGDITGVNGRGTRFGKEKHKEICAVLF